MESEQGKGRTAAHLNVRHSRIVVKAARFRRSARTGVFRHFCAVLSGAQVRKRWSGLPANRSHDRERVLTMNSGQRRDLRETARARLWNLFGGVFSGCSSLAGRPLRTPRPRYLLPLASIVEFCYLPTGLRIVASAMAACR